MHRRSVANNSTERMLSLRQRAICGARCWSGSSEGLEVSSSRPVSSASSHGTSDQPFSPDSAHERSGDRKPLGNSNPQASNLALAIVLLVVLFLQAGFNAWQDFSTSRVMSSIKGMLPSDVLVLRDGNQVKMPASQLFNGDLIYISLGEKVPADLRLIQVSGDLRFDRSILTGEVRVVGVGCRSPLTTGTPTERAGHRSR